MRLVPVAALLALFCVMEMAAQSGTAKNSSGSDVLVFQDGEKLIGLLERADGDSVVFKSNMAGEVTVAWSKIKELHSARSFAVAQKGVKFGRRHQDINDVPQGAVQMSNQVLEVGAPEAARMNRIPVTNAAHLIGEEEFERALGRPSLFAGWKGAASFGGALVLATQNNRTFTSSVSLARSIPVESWQEPENKTIVDFSSSYGELTEPGQPRVKTSIFHADAERDEFFEDNLYVFGEGAFDHNFSQGLDLQQSYGSGVGWSAIKETNETLDFKGQLTYVKQQFLDPVNNKNLFGSIFSQSYSHKFKRNIVLNEQLSISPSWNDTNAYSANGFLNLQIPVFKRIGLTLGTLDTFLNDPSPGFRKNSFQFTTSASYVLP